MTLKKVTIQGYRSVRDSQILFVDDLVTVLIGANDHGKSNLLKAVRALDDDAPFAPDDRHWDLTDDERPLVSWEFELTPNQRTDLAAARQPTEGPDEEDSKESMVAATTVSYPSTVTFIREGAGSAVQVLDEENVFDDSQVTLLLSWRPRVELFDVQQSVVDEVQLAQLDQPQFEFMRGLFEKAGIWEDRSQLFSQTPKSTRMLDEASKRLTDVLRREWEQGKELEWKFVHGGSEGNVVRLLIKDPAVTSSYVRPSQRSQGFTSFFILSLTVYARTQAKAEDAFIFLFDEPGTYLHPIAQVNLQRVFESLASKSQILYATHSIFLVNKNVPSRNRVVRKVEEGTVIDRKPFTGNWKAVRESLGLLLTHNFLISDRTLLVEGPSDEIYLAATLLYMIRGGVTDVDLNDFSVAQAGNSRNMLGMACVMLEEGRKVVVLVDGDRAGAHVERELQKVAGQEINGGRLEIHRLPASKSIEDLLPRRDFLLQAVAESASRLVSDDIRTLATGIQAGELRSKLDEREAAGWGLRTLGKGLEDASKEWFVPKEPVAKILIALKYEDLMRDKVPDADNPIAGDLVSLVQTLTEKLGLQPRQAERKINEEP